jgi:hypothetical protein
MRSKTWHVDQRGAGTVVALALVAAIVGVTLIMFNVSARVLQQARLNALADNAAVAAADALRGLVAGYPCEVARELAPVTTCVIIENDVLLEVASDGLTARARAGEPG